MLALLLVTTAFALLVARQSTAANPVRITEHSARVLIWLHNHPRLGTPKSRRAVAAQAHHRVWRGLRLAGVVQPFMCIHRYEQPTWYAWAPPYSGGLSLSEGYIRQFAPDFFRTWGYANRWPIVIQIVAGYRAVWGYDHGHRYGYSPWSSRGRCGL